MILKKISKYFSAALVLGALGASGLAQAATCTVTLGSTNPDGSLTSATHCDAAPADPSSPANTQAGLNADNPGGLGLSWTFIDRDPSGTGTELAFAITGEDDGTWRINKDLISSYNRFVVTLKGGSPLANNFLWFLIDTSVGANPCSASLSAAGWDLCGTWDMYGTNGDSKDVSHMDLFAANQTQGPVTPQQIPEPSTTLLLALGVLGLALGRKRPLKSNS
jgi:hypothetical protein